MTITGAEEVIPARNGGSELVDYSLKESNRRLILERRKVALFSDRTAAYSSLSNDAINITIAPGANDEWLDGRSSYITATLNVTGTGNTSVYLPNGPASCFQQVQIISASGQQLVNIMDYHTIQQMFTEWTSAPEWTEGAGQMYGAGNWERGQWDPARYVTKSTATVGYASTYNPTSYDPFNNTVPNIAYSGSANAGAEAVGVDVIIQRPAGEALALQKNLTATQGLRVAFRLDLAWIFGNATLIPAQYFPLTLRATLVNPAQSLSLIGCESAIDANGVPSTGIPDAVGPLSLKNTNAQRIPGITAGTDPVPGSVDLTFTQVKFMASLCKVSPTFKQKVEGEMSSGTFSMTVTNYYTALNTIAPGNNAVTINTTFSAHDCQAFYVTLIPQQCENTFLYNFGYKWGGNDSNGNPYITSSQLLLNGRYFPPQPNTTLIDHFHDTLDAFNTTSENVAFSPVSFWSYAKGRNFALGFLLDRDNGSSLTGVSSVSSPVWTWQASIPNMPNYTMNVHSCIAYTQVLEIQKDGQIKIFQ